MAKQHTIVRSDDATTILINGDRASPEPAFAIVKFPGGHVEVTRTTDGDYWAHLAIDSGTAIADSRIDYTHEGYKATGGEIPDVPHADKIQHIAMRIRVKT